MSNIYYDPEKFGLRTVGEAEFSSGDYQFDTTVVWQDTETGAVYFADDAGCSCPSPFEFMGRADITRIERMQDLIDHLEERKRESYYYERDSAGIDAECADLILAAGKAKS
ncbi:MAG: hypothetical protein HOQ21_17435 [Dermatophilaceae bacterium]|nr:hypothetical protein [Dermatophilaceae bacterium]